MYLWETALNKLDVRCLYMDTDAVLYLHHPNFEDIAPQGRFFGQYESELERGDAIHQFVSLGPKSYAYRTRSGKMMIKMKGIGGAFGAKDSLTFEVLRNVLLQKIEPLDDFYDQFADPKLKAALLCKKEMFAKKEKGAFVVVPDFRFKRSLVENGGGRVWEDKGVKIVRFKFTKRCIAFWGEKKIGPKGSLANLLARCVRTVPWGYTFGGCD